MPRFLQHNFYLKISSLIFAAMIWLSVKSNIQDQELPGHAEEHDVVTRAISRPVLLQWDAVEPKAVRARPSIVTISMSGDARAMNTLKAEDVRAFVEISASASIPGLFPIQLVYPKGVTPIQVLPYAVRLEPLPQPPSP